MEQKIRNTVKTAIIFLIFAGLVFAYYNVIKSRIHISESQKILEEKSEEVCGFLNKSDRIQCNAELYLVMENEEAEEDPPDMQVPAYTVKTVYDKKYDNLFYQGHGITEYVDYDAQQSYAYTLGVSPVYVQQGFQNVSTGEWYRYACESSYDMPRRTGQSGEISYGYLQSTDYLRSVEKDGEEEINGVVCTRYIINMNSTLLFDMDKTNTMAQFHQTLTAAGLNADQLKKDYPDVYDMMEDLFFARTEEMLAWVDPDGKLIRIQKDYTFPYYLSVMAENSEKIKDQVGKYGYPEAYYQQIYAYSPGCEQISFPRAYRDI